MEEGNNFIRSEKKKKKRKRIDVKMEIVPEHPEKIAPLVGYFPTGFDPHKDSISKDDEPSVRVFRHKQRSSRLELVVNPKGSKVNFVGTSYSGEASAAQFCTYALGVLDKETQSLKIVPIASNKIFRLEPKVGGSDVCKNEPPKESKEEELTVQEKADKIRDLTNLYGTKKVITKAKKLATLRQKEDSSSQKDMENKLKKVKINKEAVESGADSHTTRNIPPHDTTATTPEKAYPIEKIILKGEWDFLLDVLENVQYKEKLSTDAYPSFVCNRVHKLQEIKDEAERQTLACIYSYITHLIKFKDQKSIDHSASAKSHKIPPILYQKFKSMFSVPERLELPGPQKDLLISYVLVLTLFADDFKSDPTDIAKDLRMTGIALRQYYLNLGCKLSRVEKVLQATLPVPLEFPKPVERRRR